MDGHWRRGDYTICFHGTDASRAMDGEARPEYAGAAGLLDRKERRIAVISRGSKSTSAILT